MSRARGIGVCITGDALVATGIGARGPWRAALAPVEGATWPALEGALAELARTTDAPHGPLHVALADPWIELRTLALPPIDDEALHTLLVRNAGKYFLSARGPQVVGAMRDPRAAAGAPLLAAASSARVVTAIEHAAHAAGWQIAAIVPQEAAVAAAVSARDGHARHCFALAVHDAAQLDLLGIEGGTLRSVRRLRVDDVRELPAIVGASRVHLVGDTDRALDAMLTSNSVTSLAVVRGSEATEELAHLAARGAPLATGPVLVSDDLRAARAATARRVARWLWGSAAAVLLAAAALEWWGVQRELRVVEAERTALRPSLGATLVGRTSVETAYRRLADLSAVDGATAHWSTVIGALSAELPAGAFVTAFRGRGDSLVVDGLATRAAGVFEALERSRAFAGVRSAAPVRREVQDDGEALEHFTIAVRLAGVTPLPTAASASSAPRLPGGGR